MTKSKPLRIGSKMQNGTIYAGNSPDTGKPMYAMPADASVTYAFNEAQKYAQTLNACKEHGHNDWRVPTKNELNVRFNNRTAIGGFRCDNNQLTSLKGAPRTIGGLFSCDNNQLTSLEGAPQTVGGHFFCHNNRLTSLDHAPQSVSGDFWCFNNQLTSLEGSPTSFKALVSDLGEFSSWEAVPEKLRTSPETKARLEQERLDEDASRQTAMNNEVQAATVLQAPMKVSAPMKIRSPLKPVVR
jgi:hypothetical protein